MRLGRDSEGAEELPIFSAELWHIHYRRMNDDLGRGRTPASLHADGQAEAHAVELDDRRMSVAIGLERLSQRAGDT